MILTQLPNSELKTILNKRKEEFSSYRITKGRYSVKTEDISEVIERLTQRELESTKKNKKASTLDEGDIISEDTTKATQTYTEKIKGGYFGKRRSRF